MIKHPEVIKHIQSDQTPPIPGLGGSKYGQLGETKEKPTPNKGRAPATRLLGGKKSDYFGKNRLETALKLLSTYQAAGF